VAGNTGKFTFIKPKELLLVVTNPNDDGSDQGVLEEKLMCKTICVY